MDTVLLAGASGHLGTALLPALVRTEQAVAALVRPESRAKLAAPPAGVDLREGDAADPDSLRAVMTGIDTVVSTIGLTRRVHGVDFDDVDFQCNANLLDAAIHAGAGHFVYVSVAGVDLAGSDAVPVLKAKQKFEAYLQESPIAWSIVRPSGFFWNYGLFLTMARRHGIVPVFGDGTARTTPVSEDDLATVIAQRLGNAGVAYSVGGPEDLSANEIGDLIMQALGRRIRLVHVPEPVTEAGLAVLHPFAKSEYGLLAFFHWAMTAGATADHVGTTRLGDWLVDHRDDDFST